RLRRLNGCYFVGRHMSCTSPSDSAFSYLPPRLGLNAISQATRSLLVGRSTDKAAESVRPVGVGQEGTQDRPAEELSSGSDLRRDRELAQPAIVLSAPAVGMIEAALERERDVLREEEFGPGAKRHPLIPIMPGVAVLQPLVDEDRHDGEPVVRLEEEVL